MTREQQDKNFHLLQISLFILLLVSLPFALGLGAVSISPERVLAVLFGFGNEQDSRILLELRLPRLLLALVAGGGLALAGTGFQAVFRNPLAEPYVLGISSGAALGAVLVLSLGTSMVVASVPVSLLSLAAFGGALLSATLSFLLTRKRGNSGDSQARSTTTLLLSGLTVSYLLQGILTVVLMVNKEQISHYYFWTLGSFSDASWPKFAFTSVVVLSCSAFLFLMHRELDLLSLGRDQAQSLGLRVEPVQFLVLGLSSLCAAATVAACGIIAFVGLVPPQAARLLAGARHNRVMPISLLLGALLLLWADLLARSLVPPLELPLSVLTACVGVPFFIVLLRKERQSA